MKYKEIKQLAIDNKKNRFWYKHARKEIKWLANLYNIDVNVLYAVTALTSQNIRLSFNEKLVLEWIQNGANIEAIDKIRHIKVVKQNLKYYFEHKIVKGPKISQFYQALTGNDDAIVLDTHMATAFGHSLRWSTAKRKRAESVIKRISKELGWKNTETQAAIWCGIYKQKNPNVSKIANFQFSKIIGQPQAA